MMDLLFDFLDDLRLDLTTRVDWSEWSFGGVEKLNSTLLFGGVCYTYILNR